MSLFNSGMDLPEGGRKALPSEEDAVIDKLAQKVVERRMAVPAIVFLESVKPLNYISSQAMVFFEPMVQTVFNFRDYDTLRTALEKRETIEVLLLRIEEYDSVAMDREKRLKKFLRGERKKWKWYQRWLGIATPKVVIPEDILNPTVNQKADRGASNPPASS
jgi:hypothetical protein